MKNLEWCQYTYKHRIAFEHVAKKLIHEEGLLQEMLRRAKVHDMDKLLMYQFLDWQECIEYHVNHRAHHLESGREKSYEDWVEMVIDYECAPYTKPDKPLNAFDFVKKLVEWNYIDREVSKILFDIMHELGIDRSYCITEDRESMKFVADIGEVTEEKILLDIMEYVCHMNPQEELVYIRTRIK